MTADANFHYAELGMTKLLQESSIAKLYIIIKLIKWVVNTLDIRIRTHTKTSIVYHKYKNIKNSIERPP